MNFTKEKYTISVFSEEFIKYGFDMITELIDYFKNYKNASFNETNMYGQQMPRIMFRGENLEIFLGMTRLDIEFDLIHYENALNKLYLFLKKFEIKVSRLALNTTHEIEDNNFEISKRIIATFGIENLYPNPQELFFRVNNPQKIENEIFNSFICCESLLSNTNKRILIFKTDNNTDGFNIDARFNYSNIKEKFEVIKKLFDTTLNNFITLIEGVKVYV